jgi:hypothetical protein
MTYAAMGAHLFSLDRATSDHPVASPVPEPVAPGLL